MINTVLWHLLLASFAILFAMIAPVFLSKGVDAKLRAKLAYKEERQLEIFAAEKAEEEKCYRQIAEIHKAICGDKSES